MTVRKSLEVGLECSRHTPQCMMINLNGKNATNRPEVVALTDLCLARHPKVSLIPTSLERRACFQKKWLRLTGPISKTFEVKLVHNNGCLNNKTEALYGRADRLPFLNANTIS